MEEVGPLMIREEWACDLGWLRNPQVATMERADSDILGIPEGLGQADEVRRRHCQ